MDLPNRDDLEITLAAIVARTYGRTRRELLKLLGDPPTLANITGEFWQTASTALQNAMRPVMERVFLEAAERLADDIVIGVDWALVNEGAVTWANSYTFELVRGINDTSRRAVQRAIAAFFEQAQTRGELEERIARVFGPRRAESIAVTEVTRAAAEGQLAIAADLRRQGVEMVAVWQTNRDELVCTICGPLRGLRAQNGTFTASSGTFTSPPAHVRCRCWINHELPEA